MCVETLRTVLIFAEMINLRGHMPRFTLKMNVFPSMSLRNIINVCWNPQNRARFYKMINLRGRMPKFNWKMNVFPRMSLETLKMCVENLRTGLAFPRWTIWGVPCLGLLWKWTFSHLCLWKHYKYCRNPQNSACFSKMIDLRGHIPRFSLKNEHVSPIYLLRNPINVCWNPQNSAHFCWDDQFEGSHA